MYDDDKANVFTTTSIVMKHVRLWYHHINMPYGIYYKIGTIKAHVRIWGPRSYFFQEKKCFIAASVDYTYVLMVKINSEYIC